MGKPIALLTPLSDRTLENTLSAIRQAKTINAVKLIQQESLKKGLEKITVCYDNRILPEYMEVLKKSKFNFDNILVDGFLDFTKDNDEYIIAEPQNIKFDDKDDKVFYDVYKSGDANYIITGNKKHFPEENNAVTPREYIELNYK
jgi:predicted nucleic acid-binding protein